MSFVNFQDSFDYLQRILFWRFLSTKLTCLFPVSGFFPREYFIVRTRCLFDIILRLKFGRDTFNSKNNVSMDLLSDSNGIRRPV